MIDVVVSVIIPTYNVEQYLEECLESVLNQTYQNIEIVIIDDCSEDGTREILEQYQKKDERFKILLHEKNEGVSRSRNDGLACAKGKYVAFVDGDDVVDLHFLSNMVEAIQDRDICICGYQKFIKEKRKKYLITDNVNTYDELMFHTLCTNLVAGYVWNKLFKAELLKDIFFDEDLSIGEDMYFVVRYLQKCTTFIYISEPLYNYRMNEMSAMRNSVIKRKFNMKKLSTLEASIRIKKLLQDETEYINSCTSYRIARNCLWVLLQMILCKYSDDRIFRRLEEEIRENYEGFKKVRFGGKVQLGAITIAKISSKMLWRIGTLFYKILPKRFLSMTVH